MNALVRSGMGGAVKPPAIPALFANRPGSNSPMFSATASGGHELNASSKKDLINGLQALLTMARSGQITLSEEAHAAGDAVTASALTVADKRAMFLEAWNDPTGQKWAETGSAIGLRLFQSANREGFARRLLVRGDVAQGSLPRAEVKIKNVTATYAVGPTELRAQLAREKWIFPPEFYIKANMKVEEREVLQGSADILEDVFFNGQEQLMVEEDRLFKLLADGVVAVATNPLKILAGGLTPASLTDMRNDVIRWNLPATSILMASDLWSDIIGNAASWGNLFDPVSQFEIIQTGFLGTLLGMQIITDAYRNPQLRVLNGGEIYILSSPEMLGGYTDRGPPVSEPITGAQVGEPTRGWFMYELMSMVLHNSRALSKGIRS